MLWIMGLGLTLPMIFISGPLGGYLIGHFILVKRFGLNEAWVTVLMMLGLAGSGLQIFQLLKKLKQQTNSSH